MSTSATRRYNPGSAELQHEKTPSSNQIAKPTSIVLTVLFIASLLTAVGLLVGLVICQKRNVAAAEIPKTNATAWMPISTTSLPLQTDKSKRVCPHQNIRLPTDVIPDMYDLFINPNMSANPPVYTAHVAIQSNCLHSTSLIVLHTKNLAISAVAVSGTRSGAFTVDELHECTSLEQLDIKLGKACVTNERLNISINFRGVISPSNYNGFYLSTYPTEQQETKRMASTQMEPIFARTVFPCLDEPAMKANFSLKIVHTDKYTTLFNMPLQSSAPYGPGLTLDIYPPTVRMSTYLFAMAILPDDFRFTKATLDRGNHPIEMRVFAPSAMINDTLFALEVSKKMLPYFEDLFGQSYPLAKIDHVPAIRFMAAAMENWGLILYDPESLLTAPGSAPSEEKRKLLQTVIHEIAHQWFGNLVTMKWWNDLWLNEGFASYCEYIGGEYFDPSWKSMEQFYTVNTLNAMEADALSISHPVSVEVPDPAYLNKIFDEISYNKGATLIRMVEKILGLEALKAGLQLYLSRFRYGNAESSDLWDALSEAYLNGRQVSPTSPLRDLKRVMSTWLEQMNYPLVTVRRGTTNGTLTINQERFLLSTDSGTSSQATSKYGYLWSIPLSYMTDLTQTPQLEWLDMEKNVEFKLPSPIKWIKLNYEQSALYIVNYDSGNWMALIKQMQEDHNVFTSTDRAGLIYDSCTLSGSGRVDIGTPMALLTYITNDTSYPPWFAANLCLSKISVIVSTSFTMFSKFQRFIRTLVQPVLYNDASNVSWSSSNLLPWQSLMRSRWLNLALLADDPQLISRSKSLFQQYRNGNISMDKIPHQTVVLSAAIASGTREDWQFLWERYKTEADMESKKSMQAALCKTRDVDVMNGLVSLAMESNEFESSEASDVLAAVASHPIGRDVVWASIRRNWRYGTNVQAMTTLVTISEFFSTDTDYEMVKKYFEDIGLGSVNYTKRILELIRIKIQWRQWNMGTLDTWLTNRAF